MEWRREYPVTLEEGEEVAPTVGVEEATM